MCILGAIWISQVCACNMCWHRNTVSSTPQLNWLTLLTHNTKRWLGLSNGTTVLIRALLLFVPVSNSWASCYALCCSQQDISCQKLTTPIGLQLHGRSVHSSSSIWIVQQSSVLLNMFGQNVVMCNIFGRWSLTKSSFKYKLTNVIGILQTYSYCYYYLQLCRKHLIIHQDSIYITSHARIARPGWSWCTHGRRARQRWQTKSRVIFLVISALYLNWI
jgi:hypothetical protein